MNTYTDSYLTRNSSKDFPLPIHLTAFPWRHWGWSLEPSASKASVLPQSYGLFHIRNALAMLGFMQI